MKFLLPLLLVCLFPATGWAKAFFCPAPVILPRTLNFHAGDAATLQPVQAYLSNLRLISSRYLAANRRAQKNELTNCIMDHLSTLPDFHSLQSPATMEDLTVLNLIKNEVAAVLNLTSPFLKDKEQMYYIARWYYQTPRGMIASR